MDAGSFVSPGQSCQKLVNFIDALKKIQLFASLIFVFNKIDIFLPLLHKRLYYTPQTGLKMIILLPQSGRHLQVCTTVPNFYLYFLSLLSCIELLRKEKALRPFLLMCAFMLHIISYRDASTVCPDLPRYRCIHI